MINENDINFIASRALNLSERMKIKGKGIEILNSDKAKARLNEWIEKVYKEDSSIFDKRLAIENLDRDAVTNLLGDIYVDDPTLLPEWASSLKEMFEFVFKFIDEAKSRSSAVEKPKIPFIDIVEPFV